MNTLHESDLSASTLLLQPGYKENGAPEALTLAFTAFFGPLPPDRVSGGTIQLGDWLEGERECELPVELLLGLDGKVWALAGEVEDLPLRSLEARECQARQILDEFLEACGDWANGHGGMLPEDAHAWPSSQLTAWMHAAASEAPAPMSKLMDGVLAEIRALGFRVAPGPPAPQSPAGRMDTADGPRCTRCHRELYTAESIARGLGPICARMAAYQISRALKLNNPGPEEADSATEPPSSPEMPIEELPDPRALRADRYAARRPLLLGKDEYGRPYRLTPTPDGAWQTPSGTEISHDRLGDYLQHFQLI